MISNARIKTNGTDCCPINNSSRITTNYKEGSGDKGVGQQSLTKKTKKYNFAPLYCEIEFIRLNIDNLFIKYPDIINQFPKFHTILDWFAGNTFSLGSFIHLEGGTYHHLFPQRFLTCLEEEINYYKSVVGDCQDFIRWDSEINIDVDRLRVSVRKLEGLYSNWASKQVELESITFMGQCLNRFSSYIFWANRYLAHINNLPETYWSANITEFPL